jgi:hypothetical protein
MRLCNIVMRNDVHVLQKNSLYAMQKQHPEWRHAERLLKACFQQTGVRGTEQHRQRQKCTCC